MKKIVSILFAIMSVSVVADTWTDPDTGIEWAYLVENGEASVGSEGYSPTAVPPTTTGAVTIPLVLGGCPVTSVGGLAFYGCDELTSITIPASVKSICDLAFCGCIRLTSITIPPSVTSIGGRAFFDCSSLVSVTIPKSVTSIGYGVFYGCWSLEGVEVDSANEYYCSIGGVLYNKDMTELMACPGSVRSVTIPSSVTSIGMYAFYYCRFLTSVTIPEGVTSIELDTFRYCSALTSITIPSSMTSIVNDVFEGCTELRTVYVSPGDAERVKGLMLGAGVDVSVLEFVELKPDGGPYTQEVDGIEWTYMVENGEASVGGRAASTAVSPTTTGAVTIPSVLGGYPVTSVGDSAFCGCSGLSSVTIPVGVTNIGERAFSGCGGLEVVCVYPGDVERVKELITGKGVDVNALEFVALKLDGGPYTQEVDGIMWTYMIEDGEASVGGRGGVQAVSTTTSGAITIPLSLGDCPVTHIDRSAFVHCRSLASVTIPSSVTRIDWYAFDDCIALTSLTIPSSMTSIGNYAFSGCSELKTVYISSGDTKRVKGLMSNSGVDVSKLTFVEKSEVVADIAALKEVFGAESSVVRNLTSEEELIKFNGFLGECGITAANQIREKQKQYAYESFKLSAITIEPQLFEDEPKLKIDEFKPGEGGWSVSISLTAGEEAIAMAKKALEEHILVGTDLTEITAKPDIVASPSEDGASLTFTIVPPEGDKAFMAVRL